MGSLARWVIFGHLDSASRRTPETDDHVREDA
jgi:hypothetical protein